MISVYERAKEIGVSKALGASELDITKMFLHECLIIGVLGGILGDALGVIFSIAINIIGRPLLIDLLGSSVEGLEYISIITPEILVAGFTISLVLSILSGMYPTRRAAKLNPVDALRQI